MPTRRTLTTAALSVAALTGTALAVAPVAPSGAATADTTPGYNVHAITVQVKVGPDGATPCRVDADLYLPDGASSSHRVPAILTTNGFGGSKDDSNQSAIGRGFVKQGYAVLSYSGLGFGQSSCKIYLDDPAWDGKAGKQMDDVLAGKRSYTLAGSSTPHYLRSIAMEKAGDPRVGMIGGSYGGEIQYAVAEQDPRIDTIVPLITWNDLTYSLAPGDVAKKEWIGLFFGDGIVSGAQNATADPETMTGGCPNFTDQACAGAAQLTTAGYPDAATTALAKHASVTSYLSRIKVPTLLVQGQKDTLFNLNEAVATYTGLRKQGTPVKMVWQSWGHSGSTPAPGELDFGAASLRDSYLGRRFLDWMNHYVRGTSASTGPQFEYFRDWVPYDTSASKAGTAIGTAYAKASSVSWNPNHTLYLSGGHELAATKAAATSSSASYANVSSAPTSYTETSGAEGNEVNQEPTDAPGTFVSFTSDPLAAPADVVGSPKVTLKLSTPTAGYTQIEGQDGRLVLFAKIFDIAPDGSRVLKNRLIAPLRVADTNKLVSLRLPGIVHRFQTGHRIQIAIAASDAAYAGNTVPQRVSVMSGPDSGSTLGLPLTSGLSFR